MTFGKSIQIYFAGFLLGVIGLLLAVVYARIVVQREASFYEQIELRGNIGAYIALEYDEISATALQHAQTRFKSKLFGERIYIVGQGLKVIFSTDGAYIAEADTTTIGEVFAGSGIVRQSRLDTQYVFFPYLDDGNDYVVVAAAYDKMGLRFLEELKIILLTSYLAVVLFTLIAVRFIARRLLKPLNDMGKMAATVSEANLEQRIPFSPNESDELNKYIGAFNSMMNRLQKSFRLQKKFLAQAAHELRTPLTILEGEVSVALLKERSAAEYKEILLSLHETLRKMRSLMSDIFVLSRAETEIAERNVEVLYFDEILFQAVEQAMERHPSRRYPIITLPETLTEEDVRINGNANLLVSAMTNLVDNALKYSPAETDVMITLSTEPGKICCVIEDKGIGIPHSELSKLATPFYRGTNVRSYSGTGIGLSLVKEVLKSHQAHYDIVSQLGKGTLVTVIFPVVA